MTPDQLDEFQAWLSNESGKAFQDRDKCEPFYAYFNGRGIAFNEAFEYITILRMKSNQPTKLES